MSDYIINEVMADMLTAPDASPQMLTLWTPDQSDVIINHEINGAMPFSPLVSFWLDCGKSKHFNLGFLLAMSQENFDLDALKTAVNILLSYHDGARLQIFEQDGQMHQEIVAMEKGPLPLVAHDFSHMSYEDGATRMSHINDQLHRSFTFSKGDPLYRLAYYKLSDARPHRLFLIFHHYASDGFAQKIFTQYFEQIYLSVYNKKPVILPPKGHSLIDWMERLKRFSHEEAVDQIPYWQEILKKIQRCRLPYDYDVPGTIRQAEAYTHTDIAISLEQHRSLNSLCSQEVFSIVDIVTYALVKGFSEKTGMDSISVNSSVLARSGIVDDIDMTQTFGQVNEVATIVYELDVDRSLSYQLNALYRQRSKAPNGGLGLMALKYLNEDEDLMHQLDYSLLPQIALNFDLNQYETKSKHSDFELAREGIGLVETQLNEDNPHDMYIKVVNDKQGGIRILFHYYHDCFASDTIKSLAQKVWSTLGELSALNSIPDSVEKINDSDVFVGNLP